MIWHATAQPHILPSKPIAELSVCREARQFLLEIYESCFQRIYHSLIEYPISLYANFKTDIFVLDTCIAGDEIWEREWTEFLVPEAMAKLRHLAIEDQDWRDADPEEGMLHLESGEDARLKIAEFTGLEKLSLIICGETCDLPWAPDDDLFVDLTVYDWMEDGFDERRLIRSAGFGWPDDLLANDARRLFDDMEKISEGWKAPKVQLARIVR